MGDLSQNLLPKSALDKLNYFKMKRAGHPINFYQSQKTQLEFELKTIFKQKDSRKEEIYISSIKIIEINSENIIFGMLKHYGWLNITWRYYLANKQMYLTNKN